MSKTRIHRLIAAGLAIVALALALVGCGGSSGGTSAVASGASNEATDSSSRTTLLDERFYDLDEVDDEVYEAGEELLRACLQVFDYLDAFAEEYQDADASRQAEMKQELQEDLALYAEDIKAARDQFTSLSERSSEFNFDTQMYVIELASFASGYEQYLGAYSRLLDGMTSSSSTTAATTSAQTEEAAATPEATSEQADNGEVDPAVREFCDTYEAFVDEYVAFMQRYNNASSDEQAAMMNDYLVILQRYTEMAEKMDAMTDNEDTWNDATYLYYSEVMLRCSQKLLEAY